MNGVPSARKCVLSSPDQDEWYPWTEYVYLWACAIPGGMHVKVGMTNNPDRRSVEFRTNSPFRATQHFICQCPDRSAAYGLEQMILSRFAAWRVKGEWVRVDAKRLHRFVAACTRIAQDDMGLPSRFREHKPRRPNGERYRPRRRRD